MAMESPLFLSKLECPVCGAINEFETIRVGAYTEGERLTDFCPSYIKWRNPKYQKYHPLLFFTATCYNCYYTREFNSKYKEWAKDNNFRAYRLKSIKEKHLSNLAEENSLLKLIGPLLDKEKYPHETSILKLILAIFDELFNEHPSDLDLARFYLRIAWIFRYMSGSMTQPEEDGMDIPSSDHHEDISKGIDDLQIWMDGFGRNIEYLKEAVGTHLENIPELQLSSTPGKERYESIIGRLCSVEEEGRLLVSELREFLNDLSHDTNGTSIDTSGEGFFDYPNFGVFLNKLIRIWNGVPRNEIEAIRLAVRHYINAYEIGKEIEHGNQTIQAAYLIAELSRQIGDHDTARQYFNTTIKAGQDFINEIRGDRNRSALTRKLLELAMTQGKKNLAEAK